MLWLLLWWLFGTLVPPYGAPVSPARLGWRPTGRTQEACDGSSRQGWRVEPRGAQTRRRNGGCRAIRGACFFGYFLCTSKESTSPAVREPQL